MTGSEILTAARALAPEIRANAARIEEDRCLPPALVDALKAAGVFRMTLPRAWGGPEVDFPTQLEILEPCRRPTDRSAGAR